MPEIAFAAVGLQARFDALHGEIQTARAVLNAFEESVRKQGAIQLLPNIAALDCRLALREGDRKRVAVWMKEATVKYHARENYRKLGVSGKADAVLAARNLGIL